MLWLQKAVILVKLEFEVYKRGTQYLVNHHFNVLKE